MKNPAAPPLKDELAHISEPFWTLNMVLMLPTPADRANGWFATFAEVEIKSPLTLISWPFVIL